MVVRAYVPGVTVVMPHIPLRVHEAKRAFTSIMAQELQPDEIIIVTDHDHNGALVTRNRGLNRVRTEWTAFVDDDDVLRPNHIQTLMAHTHTGDDVYYPGYDVIGGSDPWQRFGEPFDEAIMRDHSYIPVTSLVRTRFAQAVGGFQRPPNTDVHYEDWGFYLAMLNIGAKFKHVPIKTWDWYHWGEGQPNRPGNTSGLGTRW